MRLAVPAFDTVKVWEEETLPTFTAPKSLLEGETEILGTIGAVNARKALILPDVSTLLLRDGKISTVLNSMLRTSKYERFGC